MKNIASTMFLTDRSKVCKIIVEAMIIIATTIERIGMPTLPELMTAKQLAAYLQTSEAALAQDRYLGRGIPFVKIGKRVRYQFADIQLYLASNRTVGGAA